MTPCFGLDCLAIFFLFFSLVTSKTDCSASSQGPLALDCAPTAAVSPVPQPWGLPCAHLLLSLHLAYLSPGICRNLKSIVVQIGIADYFKEPSSSEAQKLFEDMVTKLQVRGSALRPPKPPHPRGWGLGVAQGVTNPGFGPQALRRRPGFSKILHIKVEGGC